MNERSALAAVVPVLEDAYAVGGELEPVGVGFRKSCLSDEPGVNGTTLYRSRKRAAIKVWGATPTPGVGWTTLAGLRLECRIFGVPVGRHKAAPVKLLKIPGGDDLARVFLSFVSLGFMCALDAWDLFHARCPCFSGPSNRS